MRILACVCACARKQLAPLFPAVPAACALGAAYSRTIVFPFLYQSKTVLWPMLASQMRLPAASRGFQLSHLMNTPFSPCFAARKALRARRCGTQSSSAPCEAAAPSTELRQVRRPPSATQAWTQRGWPPAAGKRWQRGPPRREGWRGGCLAPRAACCCRLSIAPHTLQLLESVRRRLLPPAAHKQLVRAEEGLAIVGVC